MVAEVAKMFVEIPAFIMGNWYSILFFQSI